MKRRTLVSLMAGTMALGASRLQAASDKTLLRADRISLSDAEWRRRLPHDRYLVLREEDTEPSFSSPLNHEKRSGTYVCAGCELPLFTSAMKFDSGTGWPSFFDVLPDAIETKTDFRLILPRKEYHCARCGGHQGHVFKDGPKPTGLRYCNNGLALYFREDRT
ncbi:MAG: peptide-methionine (R)-S-oxide reductase MsrB [Gammaproteobacteria bacterium]|nr:peptide-methionine (R)-S-oxide reductase MsrB [Gammaproteobacteria bacterium]